MLILRLILVILVL